MTPSKRLFLYTSTVACMLTSSACTLDQPARHTGDDKGEPRVEIQHTPEAVSADLVLSEMAVSEPRIQTRKLMSEPMPLSANMLSSMSNFESQSPMPAQHSSEQYAQLSNNETKQTARNPESTFSIDVDTGAYSNVRRFLQSGTLPPENAVRLEEMLNYFSYTYDDTATSTQPFNMVTELGPTPWNKKTHLLHIGLKGHVPENTGKLSSNLVFLVDVSGSMNSPDKLGLLKSSISMLAQELDADDSVSIVVYAGSSGTVLEPTPGNQHKAINRALAKLSAGGSTNGAQGIELAYELATDNFIEGGVNRVILATDGDFNVGIRDIDQLKKLIGQKRESGIALTTLGFGKGNYNDHLMEQLADTGNGNHAYIDTLGEARKVLVDERHATLLTIAQDVKIQVEFNPATVSEYRLIGYTNRQLANENFNDDKVDAGEIGAGHTVTALYEIALRGESGERYSNSRYSQAPESANGLHNDELAQIRLRYKLPNENDSRLISQIVDAEQMQTALSNTSENYQFSASVAAFGQLLRKDNHINNYTFQDVRKLAAESTGDDKYGYRGEFVRLIDMADSLDRINRASVTAKPSGEG